MIDRWGTVESDYILLAGFCPYHSPMTGPVEPIVLESGDIAMWCASCNTAWASLDDFINGDGTSVQPPESLLADGRLHVRKGTWRYATAEDVAHLRAEWTIAPNWRLTNGQ